MEGGTGQKAHRVEGELRWLARKDVSDAREDVGGGHGGEVVFESE